MSRESRGHRFSAWDGTQDPLGDDRADLFDQISEDVFHGWDVESALRRLLGHGWRDPSGQPMMGLEEMLDQLRKQRHRQLERFNLDGVFEDITERVSNVVRMERTGIGERLESADDTGRSLLERVAEQRRAALDALPAEPSGAVRALRDYEFMDQHAEHAFAELLDDIQKRMADTYFSQISESLRNTSNQDLERIRHMSRALNALITQKRNGASDAQLQAEYDRFRATYADMFPNAPDSFDEFLEQLQRQMARMDSLLQSLPEDQRRELQELAAQAFGDPDLQADMAELLNNLAALSPRRHLGSRYSFFGDESVGLEDAMVLMNRLQSMEEIERAVRDVYRGEAVSDEMREQVRDLLGDDALRSLNRIAEMTRRLESDGLIDRDEDGLRLTSRGMRRIGQKALSDIFTHLQRDRFGDHAIAHRGGGGERSDESKPYEFGDPFDLDVARTVMNAVQRGGALRAGASLIQPEDFEVFGSETRSNAATVLMLDMSRSMPLRGYFYAAKKVALALDSLIRGQYPRDALHVIGFSDYAREISSASLPQLSVNEYVYGTNMQHGLMLARRLLARYPGANKQIIIVSDGEPTAHIENGRAVFFYPPLPETFAKTLVEVKHCTRQNIVINTFMLESNRHLVQFVNQMTRLNHGRAFFISPDRLGDYVLVDFVKSHRGGGRAA